MQNTCITNVQFHSLVVVVSHWHYDLQLADGSHAIEHCVVGQIVMTWNEDSKLLGQKQSKR